MILVDSSAWVEFLGQGRAATQVAREIEKADEILVPTVVIFEVYRKLLRSTTESSALLAVATLSQHRVIDLTREIALSAADISVQHRLAMADSVVLASARASDAVLVTLDNDFAALAEVKVIRARD